MSLSSVKSETALRSRLFSSSRSFRRFTCSVFSPPNSWRHRKYVTSLTPIWRIASTMFWPCETRTSTCLSFATISSGLYRFLAIAVLLDVKDIPQVGPLQWGWIILRVAFVPPATKIEDEIAQIWCRILNLDCIGVNDSLLDLGANSLKMTQIINRLRDEFQVELPLKARFEAPTIAKLAIELDAR